MKISEFNKLPKEKQKVLVAKDVIKSLDKDFYIAEQGNYCGIDSDEEILSDTMDVKENFDKISSCTVCALGSAVLSITKFKNQLKFKDIYNYFFQSNENIHTLIDTVFTHKEQALMEACFEDGHAPFSKEELTDSERRTCELFYAKYNDPDTCLRGIMQNIIKHEGYFFPSQNLSKAEMKEVQEIAFEESSDEYHN